MSQEFKIGTIQEPLTVPGNWYIAHTGLSGSGNHGFAILRCSDVPEFANRRLQALVPPSEVSTLQTGTQLANMKFARAVRREDDKFVELPDQEKDTQGGRFIYTVGYVADAKVTPPVGLLNKLPSLLRAAAVEQG